MRQSILLTAVLSALSFAQVSYAAEEAKEEASNWSATANVGFVSDYYFRGISQSWHKPAVQGGFDITHSSGFYAGMWGSNVSPNTYPDASAEIDIYGGYNGTTPIEGLGWTVGLYGYMYPGGSWKKYSFQGQSQQTPNGGRWDTAEINFGVSYSYFSAKLSYTLTDWFGAERDTGWTKSTKGTTYIEFNAAYPLPWWDLTLIGHVGQLNVNGMLDTTFASPVNGSLASTSGTNASSPDYTDYKIGLSKAFKIGASEGWNAGLYWVGASNREYWGETGYGGSSFNNGLSGKDLNEGRAVFTLGRTF